MNIYEQGFSVAKKFIKKDVTYKNYVCVDTDILATTTLEQSFSKMERFLSDVKQIEINTINPLKFEIVDKAGNVYTLAVEKTFNNKGELILTPSNLYNHLNTQDFTLECLYINEDDEIVNLFKDTEKDIKEQYIKAKINFTENYKVNENLVLKLIEYKLSSFDVSARLRDVMHDLDCLDFGKDLYNLNRIANINNKKFYSFIDNYHPINSYFYNKFQTKVEISYLPQVKEPPIYEPKGEDLFVDVGVIPIANPNRVDDNGYLQMHMHERKPFIHPDMVKALHVYYQKPKGEFKAEPLNNNEPKKEW